MTEWPTTSPENRMQKAKKNTTFIQLLIVYKKRIKSWWLLFNSCQYFSMMCKNKSNNSFYKESISCHFPNQSIQKMYTTSNTSKDIIIQLIISIMDWETGKSLYWQCYFDIRKSRKPFNDCMLRTKRFVYSEWDR